MGNPARDQFAAVREAVKGRKFPLSWSANYSGWWVVDADGKDAFGCNNAMDALNALPTLLAAYDEAQAEVDRLNQVVEGQKYGLACAEAEADRLKARTAMLLRKMRAHLDDYLKDGDDSDDALGKKDVEIAKLKARVAELEAKLPPTGYHDVDEFYKQEPTDG